MISNAVDPNQLDPGQSTPAQPSRVAPYCPAWQPQLKLRAKPRASRSECRNYRDYRLPPGRRCHDCEQPTSNYRCDSCLAAWRHKHGISEDLL